MIFWFSDVWRMKSGCVSLFAHQRRLMGKQRPTISLSEDTSLILTFLLSVWNLVSRQVLLLLRLLLRRRNSRKSCDILEWNGSDLLWAADDDDKLANNECHEAITSIYFQADRAEAWYLVPITQTGIVAFIGRHLIGLRFHCLQLHRL